MSFFVYWLVIFQIDATFLSTKLQRNFEATIGYAENRTVSVNYDLVVKELKSGFSENKAMTMLYKLDKATLEMTTVMYEVKDLAKRFEVP